MSLFFRSLFDSDSVLVEATQLSNETVNVEVAVKLPTSAKGKIITCVRRYFEFCVTFCVITSDVPNQKTPLVITKTHVAHMLSLGMVPSRTLQEVVIINKDAIRNVTSAEVKEVHVISPSLQPGLSGSTVPTRSSTSLSSSLVYVIIALGFTAILILFIIVLWTIKYR